MIRFDLSSWRPVGISPSLAVLSAKKCHSLSLSLSLKRSIDFDMESRFGTNTSTVIDFSRETDENILFLCFSLFSFFFFFSFYPFSLGRINMPRSLLSSILRERKYRRAIPATLFHRGGFPALSEKLSKERHYCTLSWPIPIHVVVPPPLYFIMYFIESLVQDVSPPSAKPMSAGETAHFCYTFD